MPASSCSSRPPGVQCAVCHKIGDNGGIVGPDLSQIGKKLNRAKILESILDPSKEIEPALRATPSSSRMAGWSSA